MRQFHFSLRIPANEIVRYYRGEADKVVVRADEGAVLHLHPRHLRPYLSSSGISGRFCLILDDAGDVTTLMRL